jgi:hypothetical protein
VWTWESIVILSVVCVEFGHHCDTEGCVWAVDYIVILSGVCVGCGQHCVTECCVCGLWTALRY